jgi:hypothetical protein
MNPFFISIIFIYNYYKMDEDNLVIGDTEEEMMIEKPDSCFKKNFKLIITLIIICLLIIVAIITFVLIKLFRKKGNESAKSLFGLSMEELERRTNEKNLDTIFLLKEDSPEYAALEDGDKKALIHLVKAGDILENIELQIDDHFNLPFKKYLEEQIKIGNRQAILTKILFDAQKGINGIDHLSKEVNLVAGRHLSQEWEYTLKI